MQGADDHEEKNTNIDLCIDDRTMGLTGCTEERKPESLLQRKWTAIQPEMEDTLGGQLSAPSEAVTKAVSNTWAVQGSDDIYELNVDGTGKKNDEDLTLSADLDDEKT